MPDFENGRAAVPALGISIGLGNPCGVPGNAGKLRVTAVEISALRLWKIQGYARVLARKPIAFIATAGILMSKLRNESRDVGRA